MPHLPSGTVTFLFTDIEGSTKLVQQLGDDFHVALDDHHRLMRTALAAHGGTEVSTEGDAFFMVFPTAPAAAGAALDAQHAFLDHSWPQEAVVRVRMGMHTGTAVLAGDNYGGLDVHIAARIGAAGHGGQILLSETSASLVRDAVPHATLTELGEHRLKDIERPQRIFQLCAPGLPADFPALRTLDSRPNNLLTQLTPFVGREAEVREVLDAIATHRLVTLTGPGGTGKTRLSLEAAARALLNFADGVFFVPLAPVVDNALVPSTIAQALDLKELGEKPITDILKDHLRGKEMLLVLDNFEQVLDAGPLVTELLSVAPNLKVVVTSRALLKVSGEAESPVPPMALPDPANLPPIEALAHYDAVDLFLQRARSARPSFQLEADNAAAVAAICTHLEGLPLAIELAAARVKILAPQEILARLERALTFLTGGARDLPQRQQTLRDAIAWSYDLLDEGEKALFRRLAIFVGEWDFEGAEAVCNPDDELGFDTFEGLESLADKNLIRRFESDAGQTRFRMLVVIREYALDALSSCGELDVLRARHVDHFAALVERAEPEMTGADNWLDRLEHDKDNLRAVLQHCLNSGDAATGLLLGGRVWRFWHLRNHLTEGRRWMEQLLSLPAAAERSEARAKGLMALGSLAYWQSDFDDTRAHYTEGLEIYREIGDRAGVAEALFNLGYLAAVGRDYATAIERHTEARALYRELGDRLGEAWATTGAGLAYALSRELDKATEFSVAATALFVELDNWFGEWNARFVEIQALRFAGRFDEALEIAVPITEASLANGDLSGVAGALDGLADIEWHRAHHELAVTLAGAADGIKEAIGGGAPATLVDAIDIRAAATEVLDQATAEAAWTKGREMSPEEAIAVARKEIELG